MCFRTLNKQNVCASSVDVMTWSRKQCSVNKFFNRKLTNKWHNTDSHISHGPRVCVLTQLLEEQSDAFARDGQRVVQRRLDELPVSCSQAEQLLPESKPTYWQAHKHFKVILPEGENIKTSLH